MRSHAKASSAGSTQRQAGGLGRFVRGAFAGRDASSGADGGSALSYRIPGALFVALLALAALAPVASAAVSTRYPQTASFGTDGTSGTSFSTNPRQLSFNQAAKYLYVLNASPEANRKIYGFDASTPGTYTPLGGNFPVAVGAAGGESDIAIDNTAIPSATAGYLYYESESSQSVFGFDSAGAALGAPFPIVPGSPRDLTGVGVDPSGYIWVGDWSAKKVRKYDPATGTEVGSLNTETIANGRPAHPAFDSNGDMYLAMYSGATYKLTSSSGYDPSQATLVDSASTRDVAVDATNHRIYVVHSNKVSAYNSSGTFLYEFASGISGENLFGAAVNQATDTVYVADDGNDKVYAYGPAQSFGDATAATTPPTNVTDTSATINATVTDNNALPTSWRLEFSKDGGTSWNIVGSGKTAGGQSGVAVNANVSGLTPNSPGAYRYRVVTNKGFGATDVVSSPTSFGTLSVAPAVSNTGAVQVQDTSARLVGTIDPKNAETAYAFEYGTTPFLGTTTPPVNIGGGTTPIVVSQVISGLAKDTTYYFRLTAINPFGTANGTQATLHTRAVPLPDDNAGNCSNEALRQSQSTTFLPDCRAYEQVSPVEKNGGDGFVPSTDRFADLYVSPDGGAVGFAAYGSWGNSPPQKSFRYGIYSTRRTPNGWLPATSAKPSFCSHGFGLNNLLPQAVAFAHDMGHAVFNQQEGLPECRIDPLDPNAPVSALSSNVYRTDLSDPPTYDLINPQFGHTGGTAFPNSWQLGVNYRGGSDDQSHVILGSKGPQTPDSPPYNEPNDAFERLYDWQQLGSPGCTSASSSYSTALDACLSLITKDPAGSAFTIGSFIPGTSTGGSGDFGNGNNDAINSVSANGERIFFETGPSRITLCETLNCHLYMREDNAVTYDVSQSECTALCGPDTGDVFQLASSSGDAALFTSSEKLTDSDTSSSGDDLFIYHHSADPATDPNLTDLSIDGEPHDGTSAGVQGVVGADDGLETVFFVADGQLVAGAPTAAGPKLYRWQWNSGAPTLDYLATLDAADDDENWAFESTTNLRRERRVTPDGGALILESKAQLDPVADQDTDVDVYRWTASKSFECVSCQLPGTDSGGPSTTGRVGRPALGTTINVTNEMSTAISDDGERIFFQTPDALVPGDINGPCAFSSELSFYPCTDVYEWHDGALALITPGDSADETDVQLAGTTPSGEDVFFATRQPLVGWDQDDNLDVYDARVGGGFPEPPVGEVCEGEACRGVGSEAPETEGAGTAVFSGPGNRPHVKRKRCPKGKRKVRRKGKVRCIKRHPKRSRRRAANHNRRVSR